VIGDEGLLVLLTPRAAALERGPELALRLAGSAGRVVSLQEKGIRNLARRQTPAELEALDKLLGEAGPLVGLVLAGRVLRGGDSTPEAAGSGLSPPGIILVRDHIAFTVPSPLAGPNDDRRGPRFPVVAGRYRPEVAAEALRPSVIPEGVVVCVREEGAPDALETELMRRPQVEALSEELAGIVLPLAHRDRWMAAVLIDEEGGG